MVRLYLDANATEPLRPAARAAVLAALDAVGNASAVHADGRTARRLLEAARSALAQRFGAAPGEIIFTSGGTEANALAIQALGAGRRRLIGATEHPAVLAAAPGATPLPVGTAGQVDLEALAALLADGPPALVCLMAANNESGVLHPLAAAAALCSGGRARESSRPSNALSATGGWISNRLSAERARAAARPTASVPAVAASASRRLQYAWSNGTCTPISVRSSDKSSVKSWVRSSVRS
jgi:cysteine desulfurase